MCYQDQFIFYSREEAEDGYAGPVEEEKTWDIIMIEHLLLQGPSEAEWHRGSGDGQHSQSQGLSQPQTARLCFHFVVW